MKNTIKKRQRIRNLSVNEFKKLFSLNLMIDIDKTIVKEGRLKPLINLLKSEQARDIGRGILAILAVGGVIAVAATAPNCFLLLKGFRKKYYKKIPKETYNNCIKNLRQYDYIYFKIAKDGSTVIGLTEKGKNKAEEIQFANIQIEKPEKWDKKWRLVIFDIPEKHKSARDALRWKLRELGFYKFQNSAFLYPYECFKEIDALCRIFNTTSFVRYLVVDEFYYDKQLKEYFNL